MPIKFEHNGTVFEVDTPEQAVSLLDLLERRTAAKSLEHPPESAALSDSPIEAEICTVTWSPQLFLRFIARLGKSQRLVLQYMAVRGGSAADWELRRLVGVAGNQALAGVLSGVARQAIAEKIPPRAVFVLENLRSDGKRSSRYALSEGFLQATKAAQWPSLTEQLTEFAATLEPVAGELDNTLG